MSVTCAGRMKRDSVAHAFTGRDHQPVVSPIDSMAFTRFVTSAPFAVAFRCLLLLAAEHFVSLGSEHRFHRGNLHPTSGPRRGHRSAID